MFNIKDFHLGDRVGNYILVGQLGSKAYGTNTPESDDDFTGVVVAPLSHYIGLKKWENDGTLKIDLKESHNVEMTAFDVRKFIRLALAFNPNIIPLLYLRQQDYEIITDGGQKLISVRDAFTSKRAYATMIGYAYSQRHAVVNCNTGKLGKKRKDLVAKFGYDTKYASHTIRILNMAIEFFRDGKLNVYRAFDRDELLDIRQGRWTLGQWISEVDNLLTKAKEAEKESNLPETPDFERVNDLCMELIETYAKDDWNYVYDGT
jgi:hypothetical protein